MFCFGLVLILDLVLVLALILSLSWFGIFYCDPVTMTITFMTITTMTMTSMTSMTITRTMAITILALVWVLFLLFPQGNMLSPCSVQTGFKVYPMANKIQTCFLKLPPFLPVFDLLSPSVKSQTKCRDNKICPYPCPLPMSMQTAPARSSRCGSASTNPIETGLA